LRRQIDPCSGTAVAVPPTFIIARRRRGRTSPSISRVHVAPLVPIPVRAPIPVPLSAPVPSSVLTSISPAVFPLGRSPRVLVRSALLFALPFGLFFYRAPRFFDLLFDEFLLVGRFMLGGRARPGFGRDSSRVGARGRSVGASFSFGRRLETTSPDSHQQLVLHKKLDRGDSQCNRHRLRLCLFDFPNLLPPFIL
jgi:hypothetical protein